MHLDEKQKERITAALYADPRSETMARRLEDLQSSEELHQFALNYNVNDGFNPIWFIIRSALCDKGTALYAHWLFDEIILSPPERHESTPDPEWDAAGLIAEIEERFTSGFYKRQEIAFDPKKELEWTQNEEQDFRAGKFSFPGVMLEVTPGRPVEREWLC